MSWPSSPIGWLHICPWCPRAWPCGTTAWLRVVRVRAAMSFTAMEIPASSSAAPARDIRLALAAPAAPSAGKSRPQRAQASLEAARLHETRNRPTTTKMLPGMRTSRAEGSAQSAPALLRRQCFTVPPRARRLDAECDADPARPGDACAEGDAHRQPWADVEHADRLGAPHLFGARRRAAPTASASPSAAAGTAVLAEQPFPYVLPEGTRHMVLWCAGSPDAWSEASITSAIARNVDEREGASHLVREPEEVDPGRRQRPPRPGIGGRRAGRGRRRARARRRPRRRSGARARRRRRATPNAAPTKPRRRRLRRGVVGARRGDGVVPQEVSLIDRQMALPTPPRRWCRRRPATRRPASHRWVATPPPPAPPPLQSVASILAAHGAPSGGGGGGGESLRTLLDGLGVGEKALNALDRPDISAASLAARSAADVADDLGLRIEDARVIVAAAASLAGR